MKKRNRYGPVTAMVVIGLAMPFTINNVDYSLSRTAIIQAATKRITLKRNAYVYNYRGRRVGRSKLYRNHSYRYYSIRYIHGKKYYRVGKNRYVKAANARIRRGSSSTNSSSSKNTINTNGMGTPKFQVKIDKDNVDIYSASHSTTNGSWLTSMPLHGTYNVYAEDNGMYEIGKGQWIDEDDADSVVANNTNTISSTSVKNTDNESTSSKTIRHKRSKKNSSKNKGKNPSTLSQSQKDAYIEQFVELVNKDREALGRQPLTLNSELSQEAYQRSVHDGTSLVKTGHEDHHVDENGNSLMPDDSNAEVCTMLSNEDDIPTFAYDQFMKNDAGANWEHKEILLSSDYSEIGVGIFIGNGPSTYTYGSLVAELR